MNTHGTDPNLKTTNNEKTILVTQILKSKRNKIFLTKEHINIQHDQKKECRIEQN
jgi:hypothetical protein